MGEKNDGEKNVDEFMLPGFRFHPTDEELVGFYLKRKLQQRSLPIELIKQLDIYKHDPWDLPKLASTGEKEWYFYCPRDRKYRNSTRPNRVTGSGFWKATGTDRPIYSSDGGKCIGLKKSLVFYRGRAAKGLKTDWMMHEFRLPSTTDGAPPPKKIFDKNLPAIDAWAICRIFKKTNSTAQRAISQYNWAANSLSETPPQDGGFTYQTHQLNPAEIVSSTSENEFQQTNTFSSLNIPYNTSFNKPQVFTNSSKNDYFNPNLIFSPPEEQSGTTKSTIDLTSMLFNVSTPFEQQHQFNGYSASSSQLIQESISAENEQSMMKVHNQWGDLQSMGFPFSLEAINGTPYVWDSPSACPSEISSTTFSTNKCYI